MPVSRRIIDDRLYVHFVTFSCYRRRMLLDADRSKRIVLGCLHSEMQRQAAKCVGFVLMSNHVHFLLWFDVTDQLSHFLKDWKRNSSSELATFLRRTEYGKSIPPSDPIWTPRYYAFEIETTGVLEQKLNYIHDNPVRAGMVSRQADYRWSSARWYERREDVGIPISWTD
ncbi:REP-associated tyrosine transposase [Stratiformator vulcanicus]|uniref:Transposase IS200 like protein n=1 Tax=Stratiformator vulcanicus TaxID=2527980 RepID=A0A517R7U7_9PLAN|nr:transposase [Stratiformator vulcanicus]QDT39903.1 Transposase IS200 like protein [Stratiformator vulcanicus]